MTYGDFGPAKISEGGSIVWQKTYGGSYHEDITDIIRTSDCGFIMSGNSNSVDISGIKNNEYKDIYEVKTDSHHPLKEPLTTKAPELKLN